MLGEYEGTSVADVATEGDVGDTMRKPGSTICIKK